MQNRLMDVVEKSTLKPTIPKFEIGDTVDVHVRILEGDKERIQIFNGVVIARSGRAPRDVHRAPDRPGRGRRAEVPAPVAADRRHRRQAVGQGPPRQAVLSAPAFGQGGPPEGAVHQHHAPAEAKAAKAERRKARAAKKAKAAATS